MYKSMSLRVCPAGRWLDIALQDRIAVIGPDCRTPRLPENSAGVKIFISALLIALLLAGYVQMQSINLPTPNMLGPGYKTRSINFSLVVAHHRECCSLA